jgi:nitrogen PTS system EIIA component
VVDAGKTVDGPSGTTEKDWMEPRPALPAERGFPPANEDKRMALAGLLQQNAILPAMKANSKKQLLQELAAKASKITGLPEREIFDVILQRERLGSTGVGNGIAIPHGKLAHLSSIVGIFARLESPVDFEALDDQPVDLVFLLLAPEGAGADHLKALSRIARVLRDPEMVAKLRATDSASGIYAFLSDDQSSNAA